MQVWTNNKNFKSNRVTITNESLLIINEFTDSDEGTYRVLDSEGNILISVTVTGETRSGNVLELVYIAPEIYWIFVILLIVDLVLLALIIYSVKKYSCKSN